MNRLLVFGLLLCTCFLSCKKDTTIEDQIPIQAAIDDKIIQQYIKDNNLTNVLQDSTLKVPNGLYYIIDTLGTGNALFTSSTLITVGYTGKQLGTNVTFTPTNNFHPSYTYGQIITGWQLGIKHIKKGGTVRLLVPSQYAYGPYPQPLLNLPANAILDFTIKLYDITN